MRYAQALLRLAEAKQKETLKKVFTTFAALAVMVQLIAPQAFVFAIPAAQAASVAAPTTSTVVVRPSSLNNWYFYDDTADLPLPVTAGQQNMVAGPSTPPQGTGSAEMTVSGTQRKNIATLQFNGVDLSALTSLGFSTYQPNTNPGSLNKAIYLNFDVDFDNTVSAPYMGRLVYVPQDNGSVSQNTWQNWSTLGGMWRWSRFDTNGAQWPDGNTTALRSWSSIISAFPHAEIGGQMLLRAGEPYPDGFTGNTDAFIIGFNNNTTTYDFEPDAPKVPSIVDIKKVWLDAQGNEVTAPDNKTDVNIHVVYGEGDNTDCTYDDNGVLTCDHTINSTTTDTIKITETGVPTGWAVDPTTVGDIHPNCAPIDNVKGPRDQGPLTPHCTATVINKLVAPAPCNTELIANGGFESPVVTDNQKWDIFPSGTEDLDWSAKWVRTSGSTPDIANVELHRGVAGWNSHSGAQHTELDSDWGGPSSSQSGEDASVSIFQDLATVIGGTYNVSLWTSPRPGQAPDQNKTEVKAGANILGIINENGASNSNTVWTQHTYTFVATSTLTRLAITDMGPGDSLGGFVDDVSVKQDCLSTVKICKLDDHQNPLGGWDVFLKGYKADSVTVQPDGNDHASISLPAGNYVLKASGTYTYRPNDPDASISDAAYSKRLPTDSVYGGAFAPWVRENDFPVGFVGWLGIQANDAFTDWGSTFSATHDYTSNYTLAADGTIKFRILDDNYSDNSGSLKVDIYPVYEGTTEVKDGCATLTNVPYGTYKLGEIMQDGWTNVSGNGSSQIVNEPNETFTLVNHCGTEACSTPVPKLHLIKVICGSYGDINGNEEADRPDVDATDGNYVHFKNYHNNDGDVSFDPLDPQPVDPSEMPVGEFMPCIQGNGWTFKLSTNQNQTLGIMNTPATTDGEYVTPISGPGSDLTPELQTGIRNGNFWVSENEQEGYDFAALRCYTDAIYGDNLEFVNIGNDNPTDIYCIAYNVAKEDQPAPCRGLDDAFLVSGEATKFEGITAAPNPVDLSDLSFYNTANAGAAVPAGPTGFPGAWDIPLNDSNLNAGVTGAQWVSNSSVSPSTPPTTNGSGSVDSWRLFSHEIDIPAGAVGISSETLYYSGDNAVEVFLVNETDHTTQSIGTTGNASVNPGNNTPLHFQHVYSATIPTLLADHNYKLEFAVMNWANSDFEFNPTGLIYSTTYGYDCDNGGGNPDKFSIAGNVYNDKNNSGTKDSEDLENPDTGLAGWTVYIDADDDGIFDEGETSTTSDDNGDYLITDLAPDCYIVREVLFDDSWLNGIQPTDGKYEVAIGGASCSPVSFLGLFKTAQAATAGPFSGNAVGLDFGNIDNPQGGCVTNCATITSGSGGNNRRTPRVLGDSTDVPSNPGQVLGATDTLPRTGMPTWALLMIAILAVPAFSATGLKIKKSQE